MQRSKDGINFITLDQVKGHGITSAVQQYSWTDQHPLVGINYYRLKQVDYDGKSEYHPIIPVEYQGKTTDADIRLYPTEVKDLLMVTLEEPSTEETTLIIVDQLGRVLQRHRLGSGTAQQELPLGALPAGQYYVSLQSGKTVSTARFVKL